MIEFIDSSRDMQTKAISDLEVVNIGYEACRPGYGYGPTVRSYHVIHFVTAGEGELTIGNSTYQISEGAAFLIPAEQVSYYEASRTKPWSYSWIGYMGTRAINISREFAASAPEGYVLRGLDSARYHALIREGARLKEVNTPNHYLANSILLQILSYLSGEFLSKGRGERTLSLVDDVKFYLDSKYSDPLQMQEIARAFGIHPNYLNQIFKEKYGLPPKQYLTGLKLDKAKQMLSTTDMPIILIAEALGFQNQLSFSRTFKKHIGQSPTEYRRSGTLQITSLRYDTEPSDGE